MYVQLWNSGTCPYAARIWVALIEKELRFELCGLDALALSQDTAHGQTKKVDLQNKSEGFVQTYQPSSNARAKVPVLQGTHYC
jgi:glutathione S-transferase